ncbi:MAG: nucleotidyltransferase family protein [Halieaceae bacterium]|nr:nucleotidyltransferase family protein [Halieaceae bacterium]
MDPTAQLLHLSAHVMQQHGGQQRILIWVYDIDQLLRRRHQDIDWQDVITKARQLGWEAALYMALNDAVELFDTLLPPQAEIWMDQNPTRLSDYTTVQRLPSPDRTRSVSVVEAIRTMSPTSRLHYLARIIAPHPPTCANATLSPIPPSSLSPTPTPPPTYSVTYPSTPQTTRLPDHPTTRPTDYPTTRPPDYPTN